MRTDVGVNPDFDYLLDPQCKEERSPECACCSRPVSECNSYTEVGEIIICECCMNLAVTHYNL